MEKKHKPSVDESIVTKASMYPQEAPAKIKSSKQSLVIGVPKEVALQEKRVCLTPDSVGVLVANGHEIIIESNAGEGANFPDHLYSDKGAQIVYAAKEALEANIVLKVEPPTLEEIGYMKPNSTLISAIQYSQLKPDYLKRLCSKRITAAGFELIEDKGGLKPIVRSMSEIASSCVISIAGELLSNQSDGMGVIFGGVTGVPPLKVVIIGAGTMGENVARSARGLGAEVRIFDNHHYKLRRLKKDLGDQYYTSIIDTSTLSKELEDADVVVGALRAEDGVSQCVVSEEMVSNMKRGAVIIDASISEGGCFETSQVTTHDHPSFVKHGVIHYCVPNITARVSRTATRALSYIFTPILNQISRYGGVQEMIWEKEWFMKGIYTFNGCVTNESMAIKHGFNYRDLSLIMALGC